MTRALPERGAAFDADGRYRYRLTRRWRDGRGRVVFVLLNPSTADARVDDPTIRRCMGFARRWRHRELEVVNLFAYRATRPAALRAAPHPVGPENDAYLLQAVRRAQRVVLAWGIHGRFGGRDAEVLALLAPFANRLQCLGRTQGGHPRHVLYLRNNVLPEAYRLPPAVDMGAERGGIRTRTVE